MASKNSKYTRQRGAISVSFGLIQQMLFRKRNRIILTEKGAQAIEGLMKAWQKSYEKNEAPDAELIVLTEKLRQSIVCKVMLETDLNHREVLASVGLAFQAVTLKDGWQAARASADTASVKAVRQTAVADGRSATDSEIKDYIFSLRSEEHAKREVANA